MREQFVGRAAERDRFRSILAAPSAAFVYVTGFGGIGKSALLDTFTGRGLGTTLR